MWIVITAISIIETRRQGRNNSFCVTAVFPFGISVVILIVARLAPRLVVWTPLVVYASLFGVSFLAELTVRRKGERKLNDG